MQASLHCHGVLPCTLTTVERHKVTTHARRAVLPAAANLAEPAFLKLHCTFCLQTGEILCYLWNLPQARPARHSPALARAASLPRGVPRPRAVAADAAATAAAVAADRVATTAPAAFAAAAVAATPVTAPFYATCAHPAQLSPRITLLCSTEQRGELWRSGSPG